MTIQAPPILADDQPANDLPEGVLQAYHQLTGRRLEDTPQLMRGERRRLR